MILIALIKMCGVVKRRNSAAAPEDKAEKAGEGCATKTADLEWSAANDFGGAAAVEIEGCATEKLNAGASAHCIEILRSALVFVIAEGLE